MFDKFHIAKLAGEAVDQVRRHEAKQLATEGDERHKRTRYSWLRNPLKETREQRREFRAAASQQAQDGAGVGDQGNADGVLRLLSARARQAFLSGLA